MKNRIQMITSILVGVMMVALITTACAEPVKITETPVAIAQTPIANEMQKPTPELSHEIAVDPTSKPTQTLRPTPTLTAGPTVTLIPFPRQNLSNMTPIDSDWLNPNPDFREMYKIKYGFKQTRKINSSTLQNFRTNVQLQAEWDARYKESGKESDNLDLLVQTVKDYNLVSFTANYKSLDNYKNANLVFFQPSANFRQAAIRWENMVIVNKMVMQGCMVTDRSLAYQDIDGKVRVRGKVFVKPIEASSKILKQWQVKLDKWNVWNYEIIFVSSEGMKPMHSLCNWEFGTFVFLKEYEMGKAHVATELELEMLKKYGGINL